MKLSLATILAMIALPVLFAELNLTCNETPSEARGVWHMTNEPLKRGTFVLLKMPLKRIAAEPGDTITVSAAGTSVNGALVPLSAPLPGHPHFPYGTYTIPPYSLWLLGQTSDSWDSRYFGPMPESLIRSTAEPLFVEKK